MNIENRINELTDILNKANYDYYVLDNPTITDQEFDKYLRELISLEMEYPNLKREDSPTNRVGGEAIEGFKKVSHNIPMLSIEDVFNEEEIISFDKRIKKEGFACALNKHETSKSLYFYSSRILAKDTE